MWALSTRHNLPVAIQPSKICFWEIFNQAEEFSQNFWYDCTPFLVLIFHRRKKRPPGLYFSTSRSGGHRNRKMKKGGVILTNQKAMALMSGFQFCFYTVHFRAYLSVKIGLVGTLRRSSAYHNKKSLAFVAERTIYRRDCVGVTKYGARVRR